MQNDLFQVGFSADFLDDSGQLVFPDIGLSVLESDAQVAHRFLPECHPEYLPAQLENLDVLISLKPRVTAASLAGNTRLTAIGRCGVGYDNVDVKACTENDIALFITPDGVRRPMAESIVLLVLALSHNLVRKDRMMRDGLWAESTRPLGREPRDRVIGTIGYGNIAKDAIRLLTPFNVGRFLAFDPLLPIGPVAGEPAESVTLETLLRHSDYVLVNCPLTSSTRHLVGEQELRMMKPDAVLINTARGPIVDETALIHALVEGWIRAAALDVFEHEPLHPSSPLLQMENVILTSHSIGWTEELFRDMGREDCEGALAIKAGAVPRNVVNTEVLSRPGFQQKLEAYRRKF